MGTLNQTVPAAGPLTAAQLTDEINTELLELYKRSFPVVGSPAGTNTYTGSVPLSRVLSDGNGFIFQVPNTNTAACTFNGRPLVTSEGTALQPAQLAAGQIIVFVYVALSNHYRIISPLSAGTVPVVRVITSSSTWTKPAGLRYIKVKVQGPGGNGNQGSSTVGGTGGQSGAYAEKLIAAAALSATVAVTVSAVGSGTATSFGTVSAGAALTSTLTAATASGGDINISGSAGGLGTSAGGGAGATCPLGSGGLGGTTSSGRNAGGYGGGGGGGGVATGGPAGGAGAPGCVIVEEYY